MPNVDDRAHTEPGLQGLRDQLERERAELLASVHAHDSSAPVRTTASDGQGETEHLVVAEQRNVTEIVDTMNRAALDEIDAAIERMDRGTYGRCVECGVTIPFERLEIMPAASCCVACQQRRETSGG